MWRITGKDAIALCMLSWYFMKLLKIVMPHSSQIKSPMANMAVSHLKATLACGRLNTDPALKYCSCSDRNDGAEVWLWPHSFLTWRWPTSVSSGKKPNILPQSHWVIFNISGWKANRVPYYPILLILYIQHYFKKSESNKEKKVFWVAFEFAFYLLTLNISRNFNIYSLISFYSVCSESEKASIYLVNPTSTGKEDTQYIQSRQ